MCPLPFYVRVLRRREAAQVERVGGEPQVARHLDVGKKEGEHHAAGVELDALRAGHERGPSRLQLRGLAAQLWQAGEDRACVREAERMLLDRHVVQAPGDRKSTRLNS